MDMAGYATEIAMAAQALINQVEAEHEEVNRLKLAVDSVAERTRRSYDEARSRAMDEDYDTFMMGVAAHWETYFGVDKVRYDAEAELSSAADKLAAHRLSLDALAAALLQCAKQGISIVHGGLAACPGGRSVGSQTLKNVVWQGRNQASHWEDGTLHPPTEACFRTLEMDFGGGFADYNTRSLALEVTQQLGWTTLEAFQNDLSLDDVVVSPSTSATLSTHPSGGFDGVSLPRTVALPTRSSVVMLAAR